MVGWKCTSTIEIDPLIGFALGGILRGKYVLGKRTTGTLLAAIFQNGEPARGSSTSCAESKPNAISSE